MRHLSCTALGRLNVVWISNPKQLRWRRLESESEVQQIVFTPTSCGDFFFLNRESLRNSLRFFLHSHTATNVQWWYILLGGLSRKWIVSRIIHSASWCEVKIWHDLLLAQGCAVSEGWHVGLWRFQRLQKDVGGGVFVSFAFTSCYWLGLDPASCAAQGIRCWTCWYQTGYKLCSCDDCPETGVMEMNCCRNWNSGYIGLPIFFSRFSEEIRRC